MIARGGLSSLLLPSPLRAIGIFLLTAIIDDALHCRHTVR